MFGTADVIRLALRLVANKDRLSGVLSQIGGLIDQAHPETPPPPASQYPQYSVEWLQESLNTLDNAGLEVDGDYGPLTKEAVGKFQEQHGLEPDGWCGVQTQAAIDAELAKHDNP